MENLRTAGAIGSSLDAEVDIYVSDDLKESLAVLEDELRFVLITSYARVHEQSSQPGDAEQTEVEGLAIKVATSGHAKCVRCWHHRDDVGKHSEHPELCARCADNVSGEGETRKFG